jgi:hypothetical protein
VHRDSVFDMFVQVIAEINGHRIPHGKRVAVTPILGGLHHEYRLEARAA